MSVMVDGSLSQDYSNLDDLPSPTNNNHSIIIIIIIIKIIITYLLKCVYQTCNQSIII